MQVVGNRVSKSTLLDCKADRTLSILRNPDRRDLSTCAVTQSICEALGTLRSEEGHLLGFILFILLNPDFIVVYRNRDAVWIN